MLLLWFLIAWRLIWSNKEETPSKTQSLLTAFSTFFPLEYLWLLLQNFVGVSGHLIPTILAVLTIYLMRKELRKVLKSGLFFEKNTIFYYFCGILSFIAFLSVLGQDISYDGKAYHIDAIYGSIQWNVLTPDNYFHIYAQSYPKMADTFLGAFAVFLSKYTAYEYVLGNVLITLVIYIAAYYLSKILGIQKAYYAHSIAFFFALNPLSIYEMGSGYVDIVFVFYIILSLLLLFTPYSRIRFLLFILSTCALINIKYSGLLIGCVLTIAYLVYHLRSFALKDALLLVIYPIWFLHYIYSFIHLGTPIPPFQSYHELQTFFQTLSHAPKGINGNTLKEIVYSHVYLPHIWFLESIRSFQKNIFWSIFASYFWWLNQFGATWVFLLLSIPFFIFKIIKDKNKQLLFFTVIIFLLYFWQWAKWEVRYFLYVIFFVFFSFFFVFERAKSQGIFKKLGVVLILATHISIIGSLAFFIAIKYRSYVEYQHINSVLAMMPHHFFIQKSDYTHFYYFDRFTLGNTPKAITHADLSKYQFHESLIMNAPARSPLLEKYLADNNYHFNFDPSIGYTVQ